MEFEYDLVLMSLVIFIPTVFALLLMLFPRGSENGMRWCALFGTALTLLASILMFISYLLMLDSYPPDRGETSTHNAGSNLDARAEKAAQAGSGVAKSESMSTSDWVARRQWIRQFNIDYYLGTDGISMPLVLLTTILSFLAMIASWKIDRFVRGYCMLFLILETGMLGTFLALDFFLFYIFWEVMLLPMYFLIGVWGGPRREYAAIKFFLYTLLGSVFILIALLGFYFTDIRDFAPSAKANEPTNSFDIVLLHKAGRAASALLKNTQAEEVLKTYSITKEASPAGVERLKQPFFSSPAFQITMFLLLFVGFAIKVPLFPF